MGEPQANPPQPPQEGVLQALNEIRQRLDALEKTVALLKPLQPADTPATIQPPPLPTPRPAPIYAPAASPTPAPCASETPAPSTSAFPEVLAPARIDLARPAPAAPATSARPALSLEQRLGTRWMLYVGLVVLLLAGVFFFKYAIDEGWISPLRRVIGGAVLSFAIIGLSEWLLLKRDMRLFAAGLMGYAIAQLYFVVFLASPNGWYHLVSSPVAFGLMCAVTALGAALSLQARMLSTAVIALLGAIATPVLLSTGEDRQALLMSYLLVVNTGFLAVAVARRWQVLAPLALLGTIALFFGWGSQHYEASAAGLTNIFCWAFLAQFSLYAVAGCAAGRLHDALAQALLILAGVSAGALWSETCTGHDMFASLMMLLVVVLALGLWRAWDFIRVVALVGIAFALAVKVTPYEVNYIAVLPRDYWQLSLWVWAFFAAFSVDVWLRAALRLRTSPPVDAAIATAVTALMFAATYGLLNPHHHAWMGGYAAALGVAAILASLLVRRFWQRPGLSAAYLAEGLALLVLAVPIQFDRSAITLAWAVQGVVAAVLARRFRGVLLHIASLAALASGVAHYYAFDASGDPSLALPAFSLLGTAVPWLVLVGAVLSLALLAAAAVHTWNRSLRADSLLFVPCIALLVTAFVVFASETAARLPMAGSTWAWLLFAVVVAAWGCWRGDELFAAVGSRLLFVVAVKWSGFDSAIRLIGGLTPSDVPPFLNWHAFAGIAVAAAMLLYARLAARSPWIGSTSKLPLRATMDLLAALLVACAVSVEIVRFFSDAPAGRWADPFQAMHAALSVWWAAYAAILLGLGFGFRSRPVRYLALLLFAATIVKVFLVDMREVKAIYRILSFLCLGGLLVGASWLYNRFFRERLRSGQNEEPAAPPGAPP